MHVGCRELHFDVNWKVHAAVIFCFESLLCLVAMEPCDGRDRSKLCCLGWWCGTLLRPFATNAASDIHIP